MQNCTRIRHAREVGSAHRLTPHACAGSCTLQADKTFLPVPEKVFDGPTVGYNHRWSFTHAHSFITGSAPQNNDIQILDAGCGTGVTAQYLSHLNPRATHFDALDLSGEALKIAKERAEKADLVGSPNNAVFHHMSLYDVADLGREYDFINCVGVLHHLPDPVQVSEIVSRQRDGV